MYEQTLAGVAAPPKRTCKPLTELSERQSRELKFIDRMIFAGMCAPFPGKPSRRQRRRLVSCLTDKVFSRRHPNASTFPPPEQASSEEKTRIDEWLAIRDCLVRPATAPRRWRRLARARARLARRERRLAVKAVRAIRLLRAAAQRLGSQGQKDLLGEMVDALDRFFPTGYGIKDKRGDILRFAKVYRIEILDPQPRRKDRPFYHEYRTGLYLSHEPVVSHGRHRPLKHLGSQILLYVGSLASEPADVIADALVHEMLHMMHSRHIRIAARLGDSVARGIPTRAAGALLDLSSMDPHRRKMEKHFVTIVDHLNRQPHRATGNQLDSRIVSRWSKLLMEEVLAFVFHHRVTDAVAMAQAKKGASVVTMGFAPMLFLRGYLKRHWLRHPDDRSALSTKTGQQIIRGMGSDLNDLVKAMESHVGP